MYCDVKCDLCKQFKDVGVKIFDIYHVYLLGMTSDIWCWWNSWDCKHLIPGYVCATSADK